MTLTFYILYRDNQATRCFRNPETAYDALNETAETVRAQYFRRHPEDLTYTMRHADAPKADVKCRIPSSLLYRATVIASLEVRQINVTT